MRVFKAKTSTEMAQVVYKSLATNGVEEDSRNGKVLRFPEPVTMVYSEPWVRGNNTPDRDSNPFFHIAESMWMLAGRRDVEFLTLFNSNMGNYSDDGEVYNAAYGYRLRQHFGFDQLKSIVSELREIPNSRQAICQLWDSKDLGKITRDKACNMQMVFSIFDNKLRLVVYNRSNDLVYGGVTGANPVHFSYFQQWVSDQLEIDMGDLTFVSNNAHVYLDLYPHWDKLKNHKFSNSFNSVKLPLCGLGEIESLCDEILKKEQITKTYKSPHLNCVVLPIINTWLMRKSKKFHVEEIRNELSKCQDDSLFENCTSWLDNR